MSPSRRPFTSNVVLFCIITACLNKSAATTNAAGAGKWTEEHTAALVAVAAPEVVVLPDNDPPGEKHACAVAASCHAAGLPVRILRLPGLPPKGDVSDWLALGRCLMFAASRSPAEFKPTATLEW